MILIVDSTKRKSLVNIRESLLCEGIPCALSGLDGAVELLPSPMVLVAETHLFDDVNYICSLNSSPFVHLCKDESRILDLCRSLFSDSFEKYENVRSALYRSKEDNTFVISKKPLHFTKTEKLIISMLLLSGNWHTCECIATFCKRNGKKSCDSIGVHICNINKKTCAAVGRELIECRRYKGYRICEI